MPAQENPGTKEPGENLKVAKPFQKGRKQNRHYPEIGIVPVTIMARPGGFEPPTGRLEGGCSIQLS